MIVFVFFGLLIISYYSIVLTIRTLAFDLVLVESRGPYSQDCFSFQTETAS